MSLLRNLANQVSTWDWIAALPSRSAAIEAQLAHAVGDALGRAYNRTTFADQRRELTVKWADYLERLREGTHVIPIGPRRLERAGGEGRLQSVSLQDAVSP